MRICKLLYLFKERLWCTWCLEREGGLRKCSFLTKHDWQKLLLPPPAEAAEAEAAGRGPPQPEAAAEGTALADAGGAPDAACAGRSRGARRCKAPPLNLPQSPSISHTLPHSPSRSLTLPQSPTI